MLPANWILSRRLQWNLTPLENWVASFCNLLHFICCLSLIILCSAFLASSRVSTLWGTSNASLWILNCTEEQIQELCQESSLMVDRKPLSIYYTCAPWRTRMSIPLLSTDIRAASSTSPSDDRTSRSGLEKIAFNSCMKCIRIFYCRNLWVGVACS